MCNAYSFPEGKSEMGRDAKQSSPSSAKFENKQKLYLLFPQSSPRRVAEQLYLTKAMPLTVTVLHELNWRQVYLKLELRDLTLSYILLL
jgi:hypothetical protein